MKVTGIISEYNPFHNGHLYQLEKTKEALKSEYVISVMSGNFVMRGEPALYNKFIRAKAACENGVDLVIELPVPYALSSAEYFAMGGVSILDSLNMVDSISFGSESGSIEALQNIADKLSKKDAVLKIKENSERGVPVFTAIEDMLPDEDKEIVKTPNNILAINYLKALNKLNSGIVPYTLKRKNTGYNDKDTKGDFASATALRELVGQNKDISDFVPFGVYNLLKNEKPVSDKDFDSLITYALRMRNKEEFEKYPDVTEGLHNLIKEAGINRYGVKDIAEYIKSKRYSYTRIKRILYNILLDNDNTLRAKKPEYARVLAFNEKGRELLSQLKKKSDIPVFTNVTKDMYNKYEMLTCDLKATHIYQLACEDKKEYFNKILL